MKNKTFLIAILPALLLAALLFSLPAKASNAVVYISDDGTGDGSSPSSPLRATSSNYDPSAASPKYHLDSVLYQAADKLKTTGGTIVFVGPVTLDIGNCYGNGVSMRDYPLPEWGARKITFTSFYDGVDYRETNGARLILKNPATLSIGGWAVFKNMDICTQGRDESHTAANRVIAAKGYTLYMDVGVRTYSLDDEGNEIYNPDPSFYPSLCGGNRYSNAAGDAIVLIKSGTYNRVAAGTYGISDSASGVLSGNAFVKIYDGVFFGMISGTPVSSCRFFRKKPVYLKMPKISSTRNTQRASHPFLVLCPWARSIRMAENQQMNVIPISSGTYCTPAQA